MFVDVDDDAWTIGARLRQIRNSRKKSLRVIAGLAGISKSKLSCIERGEIALDSRSEIVALANALRIAPSELTELPVPAPSNGHADSAVDAMRLALMAVGRNRPGGHVVSFEELRARAHAIEGTDYRSRGVALPGLIRDLHSTLAAGRDVAELLDLAVMVHAQTTRGWLYVVGAPLDLRREAAAAAKRPGDVDAALEYAAELAQRTGQGNAYLMGFGPMNVGLWRMAAALEIRDYERAATIAEGLNPKAHPSRKRRATYWMDYGRALARLRGRQDDAVKAPCIAEELFPMRVLRNPFARDVIGELVTRSRRDLVGREPREMAYRAGLPV